MRPKLYCYGGHIAGICLLFYIPKAQSFNCDGHSLKGALECKSGECCTPQLTNVIKADITNTYWCFRILYSIQDKLQGQKCVHVTGPCAVELSYCYTEETTSTGGTWHTLPPMATSDNQSTPILGIEMTSSPVDQKVTNVKHAYASFVSGFIDNPVTYNTRNTLTIEETTRSNTQTSFIDGVIIGVPVVAVFLVVIFVSMFLYNRQRKKRRKQSTSSPFNTVVRFSNAEYAQTGSSGSSDVRNERIGLTTLALHGVADDTTYANIKQKDSSFEKERISKSVPIEVSDYANVQCACLMEDGDHDQRNHVELDNAYDHTNNTDDNMYDSTYQESISLDDNYDKTIQFQDNYDKTIQFQDREDTYECT